MSGSAGDTLAPDEEMRKIDLYNHLLPPMSEAFLARTIEDGDAEEFLAEAVALAGPAVATPLPDWPELTAQAARDRAVGCLLGLAIGDAVGAAVAGQARDSFAPVTGIVGGGPYGLPPGAWSDATAMALCLGESLLAVGALDQRAFMERMRAWLQSGEYSPTGSCAGIGDTTRAAVEEFASDGYAAAGSQDGDAAGNGSLVRLAPLVIFAGSETDRVRFLAEKQSRATHGTKECLDACKLFASFLQDALDGADKDGATRQRVLDLVPKLLFISAGEWRDKTRDDIKSGAYVVETLEAALWAVWQTDNLRDAVLMAANLGGASAGVAAVAGQLAGALYGASSIPAEWLETLAWRERIEAMANALFEHGYQG